MTPEQEAERDILSLASEKWKFGLGLTVDLDAKFGAGRQEAFERLQEREWIRLIDVSFVATMGAQGQAIRIFLIMPPAREWMKSIAS